MSHRLLSSTIRTEEARGSVGDRRPGGLLASITWLEVVKGGLGAVC